MSELYLAKARAVILRIAIDCLSDGIAAMDATMKRLRFQMGLCLIAIGIILGIGGSLIFFGGC